MIIDANATRMELLRLRRRLVTARKGHRLLKEKQDELVRILLRLVKEVEQMRQEAAAKISEGRSLFLVAAYSTFPEAAPVALDVTGEIASLTVNERSILNVKVPEFSMDETRLDRSAGFLQTSAGVDASGLVFRDAMSILVKLAETEKKVFRIAWEIQRTRRRVNALEYILIPELASSVKFITMKLDESERSRKTQLMRIKDIIRNGGSGEGMV